MASKQRTPRKRKVVFASGIEPSKKPQMRQLKLSDLKKVFTDRGIFSQMGKMRLNPEEPKPKKKMLRQLKLEECPKFVLVRKHPKDVDKSAGCKASGPSTLIDIDWFQLAMQPKSEPNNDAEVQIAPNEIAQYVILDDMEYQTDPPSDSGMCNQFPSSGYPPDMKQDVQMDFTEIPLDTDQQVESDVQLDYSDIADFKAPNTDDFTDSQALGEERPTEVCSSEDIINDGFLCLLD